MPRPSWPAEQEANLRRLLLSNTPIPEIARQVGRSINAVYAKRKTLSDDPAMPNVMSQEQRVARMMWLTERIAQCDVYLSFRNMAA